MDESYSSGVEDPYLHGAPAPAARWEPGCPHAPSGGAGTGKCWAGRTSDGPAGSSAAWVSLLLKTIQTYVERRRPYRLLYHELWTTARHGYSLLHHSTTKEVWWNHHYPPEKHAHNPKYPADEILSGAVKPVTENADNHAGLFFVCFLIVQRQNYIFKSSPLYLSVESRLFFLLSLTCFSDIRVVSHKYFFVINILGLTHNYLLVKTQLGLSSAGQVTLIRDSLKRCSISQKHLLFFFSEML